jgi:hypothetical protein
LVLYPPKISWPNNWPVKKGVPNCWIFWLEKGEMLSERATQVLPSNAVGVASLQVGKAGKVHRGPGGLLEDDLFGGPEHGGEPQFLTKKNIEQLICR